MTTRAPTPEELRKFEAEAVLAEAEARKANAEAENMELRLEATRAEVTRSGHGLAEATEKEAMRTNSDWHHRIYRFNDAVTAASTKACLQSLAMWDRLDPECAIEVVFNSPGGSVIDGMALFDALNGYSLRGGGTHRLTTGAQGYAASMAGILLQAGDHRWIGAESYLMIHEISAGAAGKIGEIEDAVKFYDRICERVVDIFVKRSGGKITKTQFVKAWKRTDWWMDSDDALKFGFVDEVRGRSAT